MLSIRMGPLNQVGFSLTLLNLTHEHVAKPASSMDQVIHLTRHMPPLGIISSTPDARGQFHAKLSR